MTTENMKKSYIAPELFAYGSVRNLTGGSGGTQNDFATKRMCVFPIVFNSMTNMCVV